MGTRSITTIIDNQWGKSTKLCAMYRQFDGYPQAPGHGKALFEFLKIMAPCNGLGGNPPKGKVWANGAGCLAAQLIKHFKDGPGNFYMTTLGSSEEYDYDVTFNENMTISVTVRSCGEQVFKGSLHAFGKFCAKEE